MKDLKFRVWHKKEKKMYFRGYQKFLHVLLCQDDLGANDGKGTPLKRARYDDCELLESTHFFDRNRREVYEGDIVRVRVKDQTFREEVGYVPDMFGSKNIHPLQSVLVKHGIQGNPADLEVEVLGNRYEGIPATKASAGLNQPSG